MYIVCCQESVVLRTEDTRGRSGKLSEIGGCAWWGSNGNRINRLCRLPNRGPQANTTNHLGSIFHPYSSNHPSNHVCPYPRRELTEVWCTRLSLHNRRQTFSGPLPTPPRPTPSPEDSCDRRASGAWPPRAILTMLLLLEVDREDTLPPSRLRSSASR